MEGVNLSEQTEKQRQITQGRDLAAVQMINLSEPAYEQLDYLHLLV